LCGVSTVDDDVLAGSEGCSGRTEPEHGAGDLLRHPDAADRGLRRDRSLYIGLPFAESPIEHFGLDRAGRDTIDADALFGEFQRSRLGKADHGELAGDIDRRPRQADMAAGGGGIDDRTTTRPKDGRDLVLHGEQYAADVDVAYLMVVLNRLLGCQQAELALDTSVIERDVQPTEGGDGLFDECDDVIFPGNVSLYKQDASTGPT